MLPFWKTSLYLHTDAVFTIESSDTANSHYNFEDNIRWRIKKLFNVLINKKIN